MHSYTVYIIIPSRVQATGRFDAVDKAYEKFSDELYELSGGKTTGTYWEPITDLDDAHHDCEDCPDGEPST